VRLQPDVECFWEAALGDFKGVDDCSHGVDGPAKKPGPDLKVVHRLLCRVPE